MQGSKNVTEKGAAVKKNIATKVTLQRVPRGKNKFVTVIKGLAAFGNFNFFSALGNKFRSYF